MSANVVFVADLHLGHRSVLLHTAAVPGAFRGGKTVAEHDDWVVSQCLSVRPTKRTLWWLLGDVAMSEEALARLDELPGRKILVAGNHDTFPTATYLRYVERVCAAVKKYDWWLTHIPVHVDELRGCPNVHGHCHHNTLGYDLRYRGVMIDWPPHRPQTLDELRERFARTANESLT